MLILYATPLSANGRKALAVSQHLELTPQVVLINVYRGEGRAVEYLAVNPQGKVPSLVDGNLMLWESNAILQYLAEAHGDYRLWSRDPRRRAPAIPQRERRRTWLARGVSSARCRCSRTSPPWSNRPAIRAKPTGSRAR